MLLSTITASLTHGWLQTPPCFGPIFLIYKVLVPPSSLPPPPRHFAVGSGEAAEFAAQSLSPHRTAEGRRGHGEGSITCSLLGEKGSQPHVLPVQASFCTLVNVI